MTTYKKKKLKDREGNYIVTPSSADIVYCQDGSTLEQKLNNIENDEFSPTITQIESMAKVGVGTDVDVSANVQEGYVKSAILSGQTLVNVFSNATSHFQTNATYTGNKTINLTSDGAVCHSWWNVDLQTTKQYMLSINITTNTSTGNLIVKTKDEKLLKRFDVGVTGKQIIIFTPTDSGIRFKYESASNRGTTIIDDIILIEYQDGIENWDIPYFEGMQSVKMPVLTTTGKNLFNINGEINEKFSNMAASNNPNEVDGNTIIASSWTFDHHGKGQKIKIRRGMPYTCSFTSSDNGGIVIHTPYKVNFTGVNTSTFTFIAPTDCDEIIVTFNTVGASSGGKFHNLCVVEGDVTSVEYEPYKSNILHAPEEVVLRSLPNGVCDTLNLNTGEYVKRIGEVVFDGSEDEGWEFHALEPSGKYCYKTSLLTEVTKSESYGVCDKLIYILNGEAPWNKKNNCISILNTKLLTIYNDLVSVESFKTDLSQNPITVQYELATPITKTVDLTPGGTNPTTKPFVWKVGHVQLLSEQGTLTPSLEYSVITSRGGQILDNTRQIAKQDKRIYDLEMLLISSSVEDAYQRLALQNTVQMLSYNEELKVNPIRYYMLSRLIEEEMYQESDMLDKLDAFFLYGEINTEQYYGLSKAIVGDNAIATLDEVIASHEIQVDIPTTLEELPTDKPSTLEEMPINKPTTLEEEVLPSDRPTTLEEQPIIEEVEDAPIVELKDRSKTYTLLMNKLELSIQRVEDLAHYIDLANAYICANRLSYEEYELVIARIENAYISLH